MDVTTANSSGEPLEVATVDGPPRPGWEVYAITAVTTLLAAAWIGLAIASLFHWNVCEAISAFLFAPILLGLAIVQYQGTVRRNRACAKIACMILLAIGGLTIFAAVTNGLEHFVEEHTFDWWTAKLIATMLVIGLGIVAAGFSDYLWLTQLRQYENRCRISARFAVQDRHFYWYQLSMREWLGLSALVSICAAVTGYAISKQHPQQAQHVTRSEAPFELPMDATDISYHYHFRGGFECEFTTSEKGFLSWLEAEINNLTPPVRAIGKLTQITEACELPSQLRQSQQHAPNTSPVLVQRGWSYESEHWPEWQFLFFYDADRQRAYAGRWFD
jgi:putative Mn2+ efflux pump MntP